MVLNWIHLVMCEEVMGEIHRHRSQCSIIDLFIAINLDFKFIYEIVSLNIKEIFSSFTENKEKHD